MSKRNAALLVVDILVAIDKIDRYRAGFSDAESFYHDEKSFDATIRELQIIGEATKHLIASEILDHEHRIIVDFRNMIVHEYFGIDPEEIWNILRYELPVFGKRIALLLNNFDKAYLWEIISDIRKDTRGETAQFLQRLRESIS